MADVLGTLRRYRREFPRELRENADYYVWVYNRLMILGVLIMYGFEFWF
jgi:hypothetical protein